MNEPAYNGHEVRDPWVEYERLKREWEHENPQASAQEHEAAMRRICWELGL